MKWYLFEWVMFKKVRYVYEKKSSSSMLVFSPNNLLYFSKLNIRIYLHTYHVCKLSYI